VRAVATLTKDGTARVLRARCKLVRAGEAATTSALASLPDVVSARGGLWSSSVHASDPRCRGPGRKHAAVSVVGRYNSAHAHKGRPVPTRTQEDRRPYCKTQNPRHIERGSIRGM